MKVAHICVTGPFSPDLEYQENALIREHVQLGHEVVVIANVERFSASRKVESVPPGASLLNNGARLVRLPFAGIGPHKLKEKLRAMLGLRALLEREMPDVILFHCLTAWALFTTARFCAANPSVTLFADCHEDFNNSAKSWASKNLLHRLYYRTLFQLSVSQIKKVLCVTVESVGFAREFYGSPPGKIEMYPLGGYPADDLSYEAMRRGFRQRHGIEDSHVVLVQTGKLDSSKELEAALKAFQGVANPLLRFVIAGQMTQDVAALCSPLIEADSRIVHLGWQNPGELREVLSGCDVFVQPFGQTVTTQYALCLRCAVIIQDLPSHRWLFCENGFLFGSSKQLPEAFSWLESHLGQLEAMKTASYQFALAHLDYRQLARRIVD